MAVDDKSLDLTNDPKEKAAIAVAPLAATTTPYEFDESKPIAQVSESRSLSQMQEETRGDLARSLVWLLTFAIGGVLVFVGLGRLDGSVITQSIFPSLIALAGTALGFYFGSQTGKSDAPTSSNNQPLSFTPVVTGATVPASSSSSENGGADKQTPES